MGAADGKDRDAHTAQAPQQKQDNEGVASFAGCGLMTTTG